MEEEGHHPIDNQQRSSNFREHRDIFSSSSENNESSGQSVSSSIANGGVDEGGATALFLPRFRRCWSSSKNKKRRADDALAPSLDESAFVPHGDFVSGFDRVIRRSSQSTNVEGLVAVDKGSSHNRMAQHSPLLQSRQLDSAPSTPNVGLVMSQLTLLSPIQKQSHTHSLFSTSKSAWTPQNAKEVSLKSSTAMPKVTNIKSNDHGDIRMGEPSNRAYSFSSKLRSRLFEGPDTLPCNPESSTKARIVSTDIQLEKHHVQSFRSPMSKMEPNRLQMSPSSASSCGSSSKSSTSWCPLMKQELQRRAEPSFLPLRSRSRAKNKQAFNLTPKFSKIPSISETRTSDETPRATNTCVNDTINHISEGRSLMVSCETHQSAATATDDDIFFLTIPGISHEVGVPDAKHQRCGDCSPKLLSIEDQQGEDCHCRYCSNGDSIACERKNRPSIIRRGPAPPLENELKEFGAKGFTGRAPSFSSAMSWSSDKESEVGVNLNPRKASFNGFVPRSLSQVSEISMVHFSESDEHPSATVKGMDSPPLVFPINEDDSE